MAENQNPNDAQAQAPSEAQNTGQLRLQKIYVKDVSLETPNSPQLFLTPSQAQPQVELNINTGSTVINQEQGLFEVVLHITVTVKMDNKTAFLVEVQQSGLFTLTHFLQNQLHYMLGAYCPSILFPYAREAISDLVTRAGFPPLLLEPVNFDALYTQHMQQRQAPQVHVSENA
jgi:preprotein translocase subunit SecB